MTAPKADITVNLEDVVSHWFTQGGKAEYGDIGAPTTADELVAAILSVVRKTTRLAPTSVEPPGLDRAIALVEQEREQWDVTSIGARALSRALTALRAAREGE